METTAEEISAMLNENEHALIGELQGKYDFINFNEMKNYKEKKLHHELTLEVQKFINNKNVQVKDKFRLFYTLLSPLMSKLKKTIYAELLYIVTANFDANWTISYLKESEKNLENDKDAIIIYRCILILKYIELGDFKSCENEIENTKNLLQGVIGLNVVAHKFYNFAIMKYYNVLNKSDLFVKYALLYLAYTPLNDLDEADKIEIGTHICMHSIISEDVYNIGEIIQLPLINVCLKNNEQTNWLYQLIYIYNEGNIEVFNQVVHKYEENIKNSLLKDYKKNMIKKITLLALMDLAFKKKKQRSDISFEEIAQHCKVDVNEVEKMLITAKSKNILTCQIDEIQKSVKITWVKPRVLNNEKIFFMKESIDKWITHSKNLLTYMEDLSVELLIS
ncbi:26S proteasome regulatory subunit RPN9, putative [Plasmodium knowlesi strain H]|uniref:26S proteasome regulatory subunit RPN9, putative n=3 Tax=Plasmodium knowlesi TaxID=5850 RepID=A0A5K1VSY2_PLAKH|nr:26S proteasome regulatory subunit RPN9, putative [Plasmodium knowlesi strain H]OTN68246.1 putative 26S proteasome regulatory subunit RPN9 [Plasmodium knowlesi]CAA9987202.1 26S proteasome regulatory subunit RPN9, putative [Plasmodium knowlesi strain H]SBO23966.1 26S proteasome regulatory subunit RPN9, putative [Plasmodium knowlesi strain H]SBO25923.1 26S proteasome regulatory subunit RPN9, putative [Plasmodium knowlesi strain H]VVS76676.1 26S proteasome regulatory subunit RPN9, putative [Pla|eukprot:XP_002261823.1 26S proteasome subunit, putative [Plasmodium knowlesi strain H]